MKRTNLTIMIGLLLSLMVLMTGFAEEGTNTQRMRYNEMAAFNKSDAMDENTKSVNESDAHVNAENSVLHTINHPAFEGFGQFILPSIHGRSYEGMKLNHIDPLLPYHNHINTDTTVSVINHMIDEINGGNTLFYDFYTERQKRKDPAKASTGLFFFRGKPGAPFAVVCPGGGFAYVGSIHEGFPYAWELSRRGYNAFVLQYRVGGGLAAAKDLAAALSYIFDNAEMLGVTREGYALWGSSAGARMVAHIGSWGSAAFGGHDLPKPCMIVMAYTGHPDFSKNDPPTFVTVSQDDRIVDVSTVEKRIKRMKNAGITVEYRKYRNAGHGFGLGIGTDAEGWIDHAIGFWEERLSK